ncbi:Facilitated trehalose transporter Tret1-2-like protein [Frankliniella fusca]|uniref:Facilitated trehalose transporter Tret1-2-like protein n=1 Tax=Frankliniella fusca TaxID=407009 RepID=A0AAE1HIY0_9NEOP|nr:Facilitated trehalose transporter Tret1-2-like protein [Frankliniella fusca]
MGSEAGNKPIMDGRSSRVLLQHLGALSASNVGTLFGLALGWSSAAKAIYSEAEQQRTQGFVVDLEQWSWVSSLYGLGALAGSVAFSRLVFPLGRKRVILLVGPVSAASCMLLLWASSVWMLYAGRVGQGLSSGMAAVATPIYISEMSSPDIRGALATYFEILLCLGILVMYTLGKFLAVYWVNVVCLSVGVLHSVCFMWFPDTPRWHLLHGREREARESLLFYRGRDYDVDAEIKIINDGIKESAAKAVSGWRAFSARPARKALILAVTLMTMQQVTGVNAITFYASKLFEEAGVGDGHLASIIVAAVEVVAAVVSLGFVDRLGRRTLLMMSGASLAICTGIMGVYFFFKASSSSAPRDFKGEDVSTITWVPILVVSVYMFMFSVGFGPVIWVMLGEMFPDNVKGVATGVAAGVGWFFSFAVTKFYPTLSVALGEYTCYWIFFGFSILSCLFIGFCLPETKGKTLDEIQEEL